MDLSHQSITGRDFEQNRRGYDPDAVDAHLAEIAAAVAERAARVAELEGIVESLQAKVQDADESQEALRLTLKAAAHAKEELLANAREQAKTMEDEAAASAESLVGEAEARAAELTNMAEARAAELTNVAEARAKSMEEGARAQAGDVAMAALAESEALVARIEDLRTRLETAEAALGTLRVEADPHVAAARTALENALSKAQETAEDPSILAALVPAAEPVLAVSFPAEEPETEDHEVADQQGEDFTQEFQPPDPSAQPVEQPEGFHGEEVSEAPDSVDGDVAAEPGLAVEPAVANAFAEEAGEFAGEQMQPMTEESAAAEVAAEGAIPEHHEAADHDQAEPLAEGAIPDHQEAGDHGQVESIAEEAAPDHLDHDGGPHLEVVESEESAAEISDKVDRLLEELREVT